jgi:hypothetical protein
LADGNLNRPGTLPDVATNGVAGATSSRRKLKERLYHPFKGLPKEGRLSVIRWRAGAWLPKRAVRSSDLFVDFGSAASIRDNDLPAVDTAVFRRGQLRL